MGKVLKVKFMKRVFFVFSLMLLINQSIGASTSIELPEDELAKESVLPRFEVNESVKNRNVILTNKIEFAPYVGWNFSEAIFNQMKIGAILGYHFNEDHALSLNIGSWMSGLSQYGDQLKSTKFLLFEERAPRPQLTVAALWEITAYYGKVSVTKDTGLNMSLYPIVGLGMTTYTHKTYFNLNGGIGLKVYFSKNIALRTDLRLQYAQQTEPFLSGKMTAATAAPQASEFPEKWLLGSIVDLGLAFLF